MWDQAIPSSQKSGMKMSQTSPAFWWILWHPSGQYLSSAIEVVAAEETIYPTSTHCKLPISAVTHGGVHLFCPDHFVGPSLVACPFADNSSPHFYVRLLASLLPPSSRQPGPAAVLLGQMLKLSLIFHQSLTLFWSTDKCLGERFIVWGIHYGVKCFDKQIFFRTWFSTIHSPKRFFEWFVCEHHISAEQARRAWSQDSGTPSFIYHIQSMGCSHGGVIYWLLFSIITPWMQRALLS